MKKFFVIGVLLLTLLSSDLRAADKTLKKEFNTAYKAYVKASDSNNWLEATPHAKQAFELGQQYFELNNKQLTTLHYNYAYALLKNDDKSSAEIELKAVLNKFEQQHGNLAADVVPVLFDLAEVSNKPERVYKKLLNVSKNSDGYNSKLHTGRVTKVALELANKHNSKESKKYLYQALSLLENSEEQQAKNLKAKVLFFLGKYENTAGNRKKAAKQLETAIKGFAETGMESSNYALTARGMLTSIYESLNQREKATEHSVAIAELSPNEDYSEYLPTHKVAPYYPTAALERAMNGYAIVQYTVNKQGYTEDHIVVESSDEMFHRSSIEAAKRFRYKPTVRNGNAIRVPNVQNKFTYKFKR